MAMIEAKIILAHIIRRYNISNNLEISKINWLSRGIQTYLPDNAIYLQKIE